MAKVLGLDVGDATIGVAVSDALGWTAQGVMTIRRRNMKDDLSSLRTLIREHEVSEVVVGLPMLMNGRPDAQTHKILRFVSLLRDAFRLPIHTWDERFSTVEASKAMEVGNVKRKKRAALIDKIAATIILQWYLDSKNEKLAAQEYAA